MCWLVLQLPDEQDDAAANAAATMACAATQIQAWARGNMARTSTARLRMEIHTRARQQQQSAATLQRAWRNHHARALLRKLRDDKWTARVQREERMVQDLLHLVVLKVRIGPARLTTTDNYMCRSHC